MIIKAFGLWALGFGLLAFGTLFVWLGAHGWKHRHEDNISLIEALILKTAGEKPLAFGKWDTMMATVQPILLLIFGPLMIVGGLMILVTTGE